MKHSSKKYVATFNAEGGKVVRKVLFGASKEQLTQSAIALGMATNMEFKGIALQNKRG